MEIPEIDQLGVTDYILPMASIAKAYLAAETNHGSPRPMIFGELYQ